MMYFQQENMQLTVYSIPKLGANPPSISDLAELRCRELPFGCRALTANSLNLRDGNTVIVNYYQAGSSRKGRLLTSQIYVYCQRLDSLLSVFVKEA